MRPRLTFTRRVYSMLVLYIIYLAMGAMIFLTLETYEKNKDEEEEDPDDLIKGMIKVLIGENYTKDDIMYIFGRKREEYERVNNSVVVTWDKIFAEKFIFSEVVLITIGYGNVFPTTPYSQTLLMVYCFFGVPLTYVYVSMLVHKFMCSLREVIKKSSQLVDSWFFVTLSVIVYFTFLITLFIYIPLKIFTIIENWSFPESFYFCIMSLGAVGFGDYEPHINFKYFKCDCYNMHIVLMFTWLLLGRAFFVMCTNFISYMIAYIIMDQLDCRCHRRVAAKEHFTDIYVFTVELDWQLAKMKPKNFTDWKTIEKFEMYCVDDPQKIDRVNLIELLQVLKTLDKILDEEMENLEYSNNSNNGDDDPDSELSCDSLSLKVSNEVCPYSFAGYPRTESLSSVLEALTDVGSEDSLS